jgi:putative nucleotidyltransferase with HDIG domain
MSPHVRGVLRIHADFNGARLCAASDLIAGMMESAHHGLHTINGMAAEICDNYEELNLVYDLCPQIASKHEPISIGEELVAQTAEILDCRRVSLLCYDKEENVLSVLASRGLPSEVTTSKIPAVGSVCEELLLNDDLLMLADTADHPYFKLMSRGAYDGTVFAIARMPLRVHGQLIGLLTATERRNNAPFTAREGKLMMALATMGAITLQNSRLDQRLNETFISVIQCLCSAVDAKDPYTHNHSARVSALAVRIGRQLGLAPDALRDLRLAALVHDVGKIGVPEHILSKSDRLDRDEWMVMQKHPEFGAKILSQSKELERIALVVLYHHERYDGEGYPAGLKGEEAPLHSRIITTADTFDAITTARSYREARPHQVAIDEIKRCSGTQFDPMIVEAFLRVMQSMPGVRSESVVCRL